MNHSSAVAGFDEFVQWLYFEPGALITPAMWPDADSTIKSKPMRFHGFINELSGNPLIGETTAPHWPYLRRVMGEVLRDDAQMPQTILGEHVAILDAIAAGNGAEAEPLSRDHISRAAKIFIQRLQVQKAASEEGMRQRPARRLR